MARPPETPRPAMTRTPKALLLDLDYTVLPTGDLATTPVIEAVAKASRLIPVAIASGSVQDVVCHIGLMTLQVSNKGAKLVGPLTGRATNLHILGRAEAEATVNTLQEVLAEPTAGRKARY